VTRVTFPTPEDPLMRTRLMRSRRRTPATVLLASAAAASLALAGCAGQGGASSSSDFGSETLRVMAPASPGGGWDQTSRAAQQALEQGRVVQGGVEVFNVPGAGGTVGLSRLAREKGNDHLLMTMGLVMVGAVQTNDAQTTLDDVTPIARLTDEYEVLVVPADSEFKTLDDFLAAWKKDPQAQAIAGGSAGGSDQILAGLVAKDVGIDPKKVNYVAFSGGGESLAALLGGKVAAGISGISEYRDQIEAGKLRALAISSPKPMAGVDAPTFTESGVDVTLSNWRGFVAPPGLDAEQEKQLTKVVTEMHGTEQWEQALEKNRWTDSFSTGTEYARFLESEQKRVTGVLGDLGLV
jgi:putative tricarboxylic transport membrane protein